MDKILQHLVNIYPVSSSQNSVLELLEFVKAHFEKNELQTKLLNYNGVNSLYATPRGAKHTRLLLQGHVDVVPAENQTFKASGGKYYGRGVYDMLFATACYMRLVEELSDTINQLDIGFMLNGDEEIGGFNSVQRFLDSGNTTDLCILPDAGEGFGSLNVAAKGIFNCTIRIHGKSHHGSRPWEGDGAAAKLVKTLVELENVFDTSSIHNSTMTIAKISAGHAENQGPAYADASLDIRYTDKTDFERIHSELLRFLTINTGEIINEVRGENYKLDIENQDVQEFIKLYEKQNKGPIKLVKAHGSSDARFFAEKGIPVIMLRPDGGGAHGDTEWVSKASIEKFYKLLKEYTVQTATIGE